MKANKTADIEKQEARNKLLYDPYGRVISFVKRVVDFLDPLCWWFWFLEWRHGFLGLDQTGVEKGGHGECLLFLVSSMVSRQLSLSRLRRKVCAGC
jgi:hypothetical protein